MDTLRSAFQQLEKAMEQLDDEYKAKRQMLEIQHRRLTLEYEIEALNQQEKELQDKNDTYLLDEV